MKRILLPLFTGFSLFSTSLTAAPLQRSLVAADAKWVLHLDMASLQKSQLGASLLKIAMDEVGEDLKEVMKIDVPAIVGQTGSITAYGPDFKPGPDGRGVLIWQGSKEVEQLVTGLLVQQAEAGKSGQGGIKALREGADPVYAVSSNVFVAVRPGRGILVSPKLEEIDDASRVMDGKAPSLVEKAVFSEYPVLPGGFFFLALAEAFAQNAGLPAQAEVLKLAQGGRVALGEEADKLQLSLNLKAQTAEGATQIQQVLQGLVALASFAHAEEPEMIQMKEWIRGTLVAVKEKMVSLDLNVTVDAVLKQLQDKIRPGAAPRKDPKELEAAKLR
jgi:hypothetical protein